MHCFLKVSVSWSLSVCCVYLPRSVGLSSHIYKYVCVSLFVFTGVPVLLHWRDIALIPPTHPILVSTHLLMIPHLPLMTSLEPPHKEAVLLPLLDCCMVIAAQLLAFELPLTCEEGIKLFFPVLRFRLEDSLSLRTELSFALE